MQGSALFGEDVRPLVDGVATAVEDASEHVLAHGNFQNFAGELDVSAGVVHALRALEHLHHGF
jgi:hypothetical protein